MTEINFNAIEQKWQKKWAEARVFEVNEDSNKPKYYVLEMFPYPSGSGLHMGHAWNYCIGDILARMKKMQGFNVLHPMGYDALGLPAENAAIDAGINPKEYTENAIKNYIIQQKRLGLSYDWSKLISSADSSYYRWDQWIFLKMLEKGLVYQKESSVNWCPKCNSVLANEQVHDGRCWRHENTAIEIKHLKQWFLKITDYADELYEGIDKLKNWPEKTKAMQENWIGKSYGTEIDFEIVNPDMQKVSNVIIVHGSNDNKKEAKSKQYGPENTRHWIPWLSRKFEEKNIPVSAKLYPKDWEPNYEKWKKVFEKNKINENSILVGHSAGTSFLVRWLGETKTKVKKLILIAPWKFANNETKELFYNFSINSSIKDKVGEIIYFTSNNENKIGKKSLEIFYDALGGKIIELKNHKHFTKEGMGTEEFPELFDEILSGKKKWSIFTTRPDTIFGVTFMVVSAQHPKLFDLVTKEQKKEVEKFLKKLKSVSEKELENLEKEGVFTGSYAINPINREKVPVYVGNFVVADYGSGMVMAVPAHDQRDFEFAKKYKIKVKQVIEGKITDSRAYVEEGKLINSAEFNGLDNEKAKKEITKFLIKKKIGRKKINFKLRDWGISRQRYWGTPIPIIHCSKCGAVPVPEKDLPVKLPLEVRFGKGNPLETNEKWLNVKCPKCNGKARRETETMDTFVNSSWYFLRYCDSKNNKIIFDKKKVNYWCPVDSYIGGAEHACMHLIYSRFYVKFLRDLGLLKFDEPCLRLFHQGMLHASDGEKMSKSKGNIVLPEKVADVYGIDTARFFLCSLASPDKDINWSDEGIQGSLRFIRKIVEYFEKVKFGTDNLEIEFKLNLTIKNLTNYYDNFNYRKASIELRELFELIFEQKEISKNSLGDALKLLSPICPHITEELWSRLGNKDFISGASWPEFDENKLKVKKQEVDLNEKYISFVKGIIFKVESKGTKIKQAYLYVVPSEIDKINKVKLSTGIGKDLEIFSVKDEKKYDPENKSKKAIPGMPGVYLE